MTTDARALELPAFFDGQRLTAADLEALQALHRRLRWLHNRSLHGSGIVSGYAVTGRRKATSVTVGPGFALDGNGRELILDEPVSLAVEPLPGTSGAGVTLVLAATFDDGTAVESRTGACDAVGAVRVRERPRIRWRRPSDVDPVSDIVLASALVRDCMLAGDVSTGERVELRAQAGPRIAGGRTEAGATTWALFLDGGKPVGVETTVSTAAAGFLRTPIYHAQVVGPRSVVPQAIADGPVTIDGATAGAFTLRMLLPGPISSPGPGFVLNPAGVRLATFPTIVRTQLRWYVAWTGVEA